MANNNILKKSIAFLLLVSMNLNTFAANVVLDPNANQNTSLDTSANGVPIINIATPNNRGISMNEFLQYNVGNEGQVLNNADNVGRSHLAGLINSNPNLGPHQAAGLIILQVNGANRSDIEGYIEALSREKVNVILSNENGININGGGTINIKNFTPTTGKVVLNNGDYVGIDVNRGHVVIGSNGFDASTTDYVDLISKTLELQGNLVGNDVRTVQGSNYVDKDGNITANSSGTPAAVAIDGSQLGGMYANRIKIIATDKGAGVNNNAFVVSKNSKLEITADGKIHVNKVQGQGIEITGSSYEQKDMAYSDKGITVNAGTIKLDGTGTQAVEDINLNGNVTNSTVVYTTGSLNTKNLTTTGDVQATNRVNVAGNLDNSGKIQTSGKVDVSGNGTNSGLVQAVDKITIGGNVTNSGDILTNEDFTAKNTTSSGNINAKNITIGNLTNTGKMQSTGNLNSGNIDNTGDILVSGKIQGQNLKNDGKVLTNETIAVKDVKNTKTIQAVKNISSEKVDNTGEISTNENFTAKDTTSSGVINAKNVTVANLDNKGKVHIDKNLKTDNISNDGDVLVGGKIDGKNIDNKGKVLANETVSVSDVTNTGKIIAGKNITTGKVKNDGTLASNEDITVTGSLENSKIVEGKNITVTGNDLKNSGKISVDNIKATVINTDNSGKILSVNDVDLNTKNLTNSGEILAGNDIKADNTNLNNSGKIASNNNISIKNSAINNGATGEILSDKIDMSSATSFANTGKISAGETKLTTSGNLNLVGSLHGQRKLTIEANDIENNGKTTSTGTISIKSNDFKNNKELSADTILIDAKGNVENNDMITGNQAQIKATNIVNNDLIATENNLILEAQNKITNTTGSTIYGGKVSLKAVDVLNEKNSELLGGDLIKIEATNVKNTVGTIQSSGDIIINANKVENIGEVTGFGNYEKYYVTWDGIELSESEVATKWMDSHYKYDKVRRRKHRRWNSFKNNFMIEWQIHDNNTTKIKSFLLSQYGNDLKNRIKSEDKIEDVETGNSRYQGYSLFGKVKSNATTEYGKILASNNIDIKSNSVINKDGIISAGEDVKIDTNSLENSITLSNPITVNNGVEIFSLTRGTGSVEWKLHGEYKRKLVLNGIAYEAGQPSVIEGKRVIIDDTKLVTQTIPEANGKILVGNLPTYGVSGSLFNQTIGKGISQINNNVHVNNVLQNVQITNNMSSVQNVLNTGIISINPVMTSAMFTQNVNPTSNYLMETRSKYISLSQYYGSDYFLTRIGYSPSWNRVRRLGDAYYENQLLTRSLTEQLGTAFINGKSNQELIKSLMDNAGIEASRLGLQLGEELTQDQISNLSKDLIWYVTKEVNGIQVLVPQIYLTKETRSTISADGRNRIGGTDYTYIKSDDLVNNGTKIGNGGTTIIDVNSLKNETTTNQLSEIAGDRTYVIANENIENIGGKVTGTNVVSLISKNGDVINETTTISKGYNNGEFGRSEHTEIKSIGEISSKNGTVFIEGKNYTSTGALTSGDTVRINASENVNINSLKLEGEQKYGSDNENYSSYGFVNHIGSAVNGTNGVLINAGKEANISGSQVVSEIGNVNISAENINITNVINSEEAESKYTDKGFFSSEAGNTSSYIEQNQGSQIYGNNVVLNAKNDVNIKASNLLANEDVFGIGGNVVVTAGNDVNITSDTTSLSQSASHSRSNGIGGLTLSAKGNGQGAGQVIQNGSNLIANGGTVVINSGKNTLVSGSDLAATDDVRVIAKGDVLITGVDETYGDSSMEYKGGLFRGKDLYRYNSEQDQNKSITNKESVLRAGNNIIVQGQNILVAGSDFDAGNNIYVDAKDNLIVKSRNEYYTNDHQEEEVRVGFYGNIDKLSVKAGIEATQETKTSSSTQVKPDESTLVANGNINLKSGENLYFEGDAAAGKDINLSSKNIVIADSQGMYSYLENELKTRLGIGVELNFNNVIDTFKSLEDYYKGIRALSKLEELRDIVSDLARGNNLIESLEDNGDTINALNNLFKGPSEGSGKAGVYAQASVDVSQNKGNYGTIERTSLTAGKNINIHGTENVGIIGSDINSFNDINIATKNLDIHASKSDINNQNKSYGLSAEMGITKLGDDSLSVSGHYSQGKTEGYTFNNTKIDAKNNLNISIDNGTIKGANISADNVNVDVKNNLEIASLQDYEKTTQTGVNGSIGNLNHGNHSYSGGVNLTNGEKNWVNEQTTLVGRNSVDVQVGNKLTLTGAKISNEEDGVDKGNLVIRAGEIIASDIDSKDSMLNLDVNANITRKDIPKPKENRIERYENDGGIGIGGSQAEAISRATIGNGTVSIINGDVSGINRNISKSHETTKEINVDRVGIDYNDERRGWGKWDEITAENAGTLGNFMDRVNEVSNGAIDNLIGKPIVNAYNSFVEKENEKNPDKEKEKMVLTDSYGRTLQNSTYDALKSVENKIDSKGLNALLGYIPTSGMHGGIGEQIPKLIIKDEQKVYRIVVTVKDGVETRKITEVDRLDDLKSVNGEKIKVFNNGMNESLEKASANAINKYLIPTGKPMEDGVYEVGLVYNPTRGFVADAIETGLGKMFDGSKNSLGLSLGVSRGFEETLRTNDPNQSYELRSYSQGNIIAKGALNNMARKGNTNLSNFTLSHIGSPTADKTFAEGSYLQSQLGYTNRGSVGNIKDWVSSEETSPFEKSIISPFNGIFGFAKDFLDGFASESQNVNMDITRYSDERERLLKDIRKNYPEDADRLLAELNGKNEAELTEFLKSVEHRYPQELINGVYFLGQAMGVIERRPLLKAPIFEDLSENEENKNRNNQAMKDAYKGYRTLSDDEIKKIYDVQFIEEDERKVTDVEKMRKAIDERFSQHRMYFEDDFRIESQLSELENQKNIALLTNNSDLYSQAIAKQETLQNERQENIVNTLKTTRLVQPEDKDFQAVRDDAYREAMQNDFERNGSINPIQNNLSNSNIENKEKSETPSNINETINNLRNRVGD